MAPFKKVLYPVEMGRQAGLPLPRPPDQTSLPDLDLSFHFVGNHCF